MPTKLAALLAIAVCFCAVQAQETHNILTAAERAEGWKLLFDGHSMDQWIDPRSLNPLGDAWTIEDECLKAVPHPRITEDLVSRRDYQNFELVWDWRISVGGNSGVKYRIQAFPILLSANKAQKFEGRLESALEHRDFSRTMIPPGGQAQIYPVGLEYQLIDNERHPDALRGPLYQTGALYSIVPPENAMPRPVGQFNHSRLIVRGDHFEHWLNGKQVVSVEATPAFLKSALAHRWGADSLVLKLLSEQPKKATPITLQNHGDAVWFRDIKIREIPNS